MNLKNRNRLLWLARQLDRWALQLRRMVRDGTPKRPRKTQEQT